MNILKYLFNLNFGFQQKQMRKKNTTTINNSCLHSTDHTSNHPPSKTKQLSAYTKPSLHDHTSIHHHKINAKGKEKGKKVLNKNRDKQKHFQLSKKSQGMTSKSSKKMLKIDIPKKQKSEGEGKQGKLIQSFREYCIVEGKFVPIVNSNDKRFLNSVMVAETACTSTQIQINKNTISTETLKVEFKNYSVLVKAAMEEKGVQMSERSQNEESLLDLLFKLQFLHLPHESKFSTLTLDQKRHFRMIFSSIYQKLQSPRLQVPKNRFQTDKPQIQMLKLCRRQESSFLQAYAKYEEQIYRREAKQHNQLSYGFNTNEIDTSSGGITFVLNDLFNFIEIGYVGEFLKGINKMFGWSYKDKFKYISKISREQSDAQIPSLSKILGEIGKRESLFKILPDEIFNTFAEDIIFSKYALVTPSQPLYYHSKSIFDCVNQFLQPFQPYYHTKGDSFPWSVNLFKSITFYSIDEDSIEAVFDQIKQKIGYIADEYLCGILIDNYESFDGDPVIEYRGQKEKKLVIDEIGTTDYYTQIQISVTCLLAEVSTLSIEDIILEACLQISIIQ